MCNWFSCKLSKNVRKPKKINYQQSLIYPDHYPFKEKDVKKLIRLLKDNKIDLILCTEKDLIKLKQYKEVLVAPLAAITINYSLSSGLEKGVLDKIREMV